MSILQIEVSDETRQLLEERAAAQGRDFQSWALERLTSNDGEEVASPQLARKMDEALASGEPVVPDEAWWTNLERKALELRDENAR